MNIDISFRSKSDAEKWGSHKTNHDETSPKLVDLHLLVML